MTTTITVDAHCADNKEVIIVVKDNESIYEEITLQDGESSEVIAYDDRVITVKEVLKH